MPASPTSTKSGASPHFDLNTVFEIACNSTILANRSVFFTDARDVAERAVLYCLRAILCCFGCFLLFLLLLPRLVSLCLRFVSFYLLLSEPRRSRSPKRTHNNPSNPN